MVEKAGRRQRKSVACPARADDGLCSEAVSWSLGLFGQELAHEEELAEAAAGTDTQVGCEGVGLMRMLD